MEEKIETFGVVLNSTKIHVFSKNEQERVREGLKLWKEETTDSVLKGEMNLLRVANVILNSKGEKLKDVIQKAKDYFTRNFDEITDQPKQKFILRYYGFPNMI